MKFLFLLALLPFVLSKRSCGDKRENCNPEDCLTRKGTLACKETCGLCMDTTRQCKDTFPNCGKRIGCKKFANACRRTCRKCETAPGCFDEEAAWFCAYFKDRICKNRPEKCMRACETCD